MNRHLSDRISGIREKLAASDIDTFIVSTEENRRYLSGFTGEDGQFDETAGVLLITATSLKLATDGRYTLQAVREAPDYEVITYDKGVPQALPDILADLKTERLGFEARRMPYAQYQSIDKYLRRHPNRIEMVPATDWVESLRVVKNDDEIEQTRKASAIAEAVFSHVLKNLAPGTTEKAVAWEMEKGLREAGADGLSFPVIVAGGPNSALPHAIPGDREIKAAEPILFDWGIRKNGYCSDTSRTVILGKPDDTFLSVYQAVRRAHELATRAIRPGISAKKVDAVARNHIESAGFGGKFTHGLGHGTGLAIHEAPRLNPTSDTVLAPGMICTVEPGIYLPGWGGVRLENQVVVTTDGVDVLTRLGLDDYIISL
ncbi:MAG: aminopeptidase P family protein [Deltaproteobacteria bacterium]|nr:MAG: aminopeptidase P family protein [Deltaproteobacteria bacterium]RUA02512.1 MAG: aminopeptidase P family protein [Deltaproteobacteria bacterium]